MATAPGILQQVREAGEHKFAAVMGGLLGALPPLATHSIAHSGIERWLDHRVGMVAFGLAFSATTVFLWARMAFGHWIKAIGYVVLLESVLVAPLPESCKWLSWLALAYLIGINATATACIIAHEDKPERAPALEPAKTVSAVVREQSLPRRAAAKVVDEQARRAPNGVAARVAAT